MRTQPILLAVVALMSAGSLMADDNVGKAPMGFTPLFNGKDLSGWHGQKTMSPAKWAALDKEERAKQLAEFEKDAKQHWSAEKGELVNDGNGVYLTSDKEFGDMELLIDYKMLPKADSGVYLRATPQVQIWDPAASDRNAVGSGGLFNNKIHPSKPLAVADNAPGEWNSYRILQVGSRTSVWLNGKLVVNHTIMENYWDRARPLVSKGPIQLQTHGGEIRWRNVFVREIKPEEANRILAKHENSGFESVFNGKDLTGWEGPIQNYDVKDGAIVCKKGKGGTIFTKDEYGDFVARLEFKLPVGGNNGLAIRYPGSGNPAYAGMCELQVLDSESDRFRDKLDARQYHGSAYGMVPAHRGYLRPTGEWNFQEVTVQGSTVKVELNGYEILNTDLAKVTMYLASRPHPGKDRKSGHFGFAGHSDPVQFRNVTIKKLGAE